MTIPFQKRWPSRRFWALTLSLCALPLAISWWRGRALPLPPAIPYKFPTRELEELDRAVQARFAVVPDKDFGMGRIGPRHSYFSPIIPQEKQAVAGLQSAKQQVLFYVVGRNTILGQQNYLSFSPVQGPVYITPNRRVDSFPTVNLTSQVRFNSADGVPKDAPTDLQLVAAGRRVFDDPTLREGTNSQIDSWHVVARPVLATSEACVSCHNSRAPWKTADKRVGFTLSRNTNRDIVSLHDPLGVALYCYRTTRQVETKTLTDEELDATYWMRQDKKLQR